MHAWAMMLVCDLRDSMSHMSQLCKLFRLSRIDYSACNVYYRFQGKGWELKLVILSSYRITMVCYATFLY